MGCVVSTTYFPEPEQLNQAVVSAIKIPQKPIDTVVLAPYNPYCGILSRREQNRLYLPELCASPYCDSVKSISPLTVICLTDSLKLAIFDTAFQSSDFANPYAAYLHNKIELKIIGRALSNKSVKIEYYYLWKEDVLNETKKFIYKRGEWKPAFEN